MSKYSKFDLGKCGCACGCIPCELGPVNLTATHFSGNSGILIYGGSGSAGITGRACYWDACIFCGAYGYAALRLDCLGTGGAYRLRSAGSSSLPCNWVAIPVTFALGPHTCTPLNLQFNSGGATVWTLTP